MPTVQILVAGTDITADVLFATARFQQKTNGTSGEGYMRVRDDLSTYSFVAGSDWLVLVDGGVAWRGFVTTIRRVYLAPAEDVAVSGLQRFIDLSGPDGNILLGRRVVFDAASPATVEGTQFPANTADTTAITDLLTNWLDLSADSIDTTSGVTHVGNLDPSQKVRAWSAGWYWNNAMDSIAMLPGAIYYLRPESGSPHYTLVYCDVDTPTAPFGLSDQPNGSTTKGYREMEITADGTGLVTDELAWGWGYGSQTPVFKRVTDATAVTTHGVWQDGRQAVGVYVQGSIDRIANSVVYGSPSNHRGAKDDRMAVDLVTYNPGLLAGHVVAFDSQVWGYSDTIPVRQSDLTFDAPDTPKWRLLLSHAIDAPWGFFDQFWPKLPSFAFPNPTLPGTPVLPPGGCDCGITDTFTRTVASSWGTSDAQIPWRFDSIPAGSSASVDGASGLVSTTTGNEVVAWLGRTASLTDSPLPPGVVDVTVTAQSTSGSGQFGVWVFTDNPVWTNTMAEIDINADGSWSFYSNWDTVSGALGWANTVATKIRLVSSGTLMSLYCWKVTDPMPSTPTTALTMHAGANWGSINGVGLQSTDAGGAATTAFDDLDITGVTRCTAVQFDNFNRTVAPGGWGTATPSGVAWFDPGTDNPAGVSVNGTDGVLVATAGQFQFQGITPLPATTWVMIARLMFDHWFGNSSTDGNLLRLLLGSVEKVEIGWVGGHAYNAVLTGVSGGPSATLTLVDGAYYWIEWDHYSDGTNVKVTIWGDGTTKPSTPTLSGAGGGLVPGMGTLYVVNNNQSGSTATLYVDSIDFDYTGKPCYLDCPSTLLTTVDDFGRSVARNTSSSPRDIGTSTAGFAWSWASSTPVSFNYGCDGARYYIDAPGSPVHMNQVLAGTWAGAPFLNAVWTFQMKFEVTVVNATDQSISINPISTPVVAHVNTSTGSVTSAAGTISKTDWAANTVYVVEYQHDSMAGMARCRVYEDGATPPVWQAETSGAPIITNPAFSWTLIWTGVQDHAYTTLLAFVDVACGPIAPVPSGPPTGPTGWGCVTATRTSSTVYAVPSAFIPNSLAVWRDGLFQRPATDFTENSDHLGVTFTTAVGSTSTIRICYFTEAPA